MRDASLKLKKLSVIQMLRHVLSYLSYYIQTRLFKKNIYTVPNWFHMYCDLGNRRSYKVGKTWKVFENFM